MPMIEILFAYKLVIKLLMAGFFGFFNQIHASKNKPEMALEKKLNLI